MFAPEVPGYAVLRRLLNHVAFQRDTLEVLSVVVTEAQFERERGRLGEAECQRDDTTLSEHDTYTREHQKELHPVSKAK